MSNLSYVEELLRDARLISEFLSATDGRLNSTLISAIDTVQQLPSEKQTLSAPEVIALAAVYESAREKVPFRQFYALRNGWRVFPSRKQRWLTAIMVVFAILFMICTLHLTRIYNRGVELSDTLTMLEQSEAEIRYGELERRLLDAQRQLGDTLVGAQLQGNAAAPDAQPANAGSAGSQEQFLLAREASHRLLNELVNLDQRVKTVTTRVGLFQYQSRFPLIGQQTVENYLLRLSGAFQGLYSFLGPCPFGVEKDGKCAYGGAPAEGGQANTFNFSYAGIFDPRLAGMRETFCGKIDLLEQYAEAKLTRAQLTEKDWFIGQLTYSLDKSLGVDTAAAIVRSCALGLNFYSGAFPDLEAINMSVTDKLNLYSLIVLPAVYGALGAIVYFLRAFLNPQEPNEGWSRTVYRVALGSLAGMIMAWLGMGLLGGDEAFKSIGLGLFAFAFILGFSIDVFFDLLENLVKAARRTVGQIGAPDAAAGLPNGPSGSVGSRSGGAPELDGLPAASGAQTGADQQPGAGSSSTSGAGAPAPAAG